jgi:hypothetical protein
MKPQWPPWKANNKKDYQAMIDAVVAELLTEDEHSEVQVARWDGTMAPGVAFAGALYAVKVSARRGDLEPLRRFLSDLDPEIAEFINAPLRVRGQRRPRSLCWEQLEANREASDQANDVERVRGIWRRKYQGRWKRHASDGPSAEEIVTAYHAIIFGPHRP